MVFSWSCLAFVTAWFLPSSLCLIFSWFGFEFEIFESLQMDLNTWVPPWLSPKWLISLSSHHFFSDQPQNNIMNIFLKWKISIFSSKTLTNHLCSKVTPIFLAHKNLRKFTNILWTLGTFLSKNIAPLFGIFFLQKLFSVLDRNGGFFSNYHFTCSIGAAFSCASSPQ